MQRPIIRKTQAINHPTRNIMPRRRITMRILHRLPILGNKSIQNNQIKPLDVITGQHDIMLDTGAQISVATDITLLHNFTTNTTSNIVAANKEPLKIIGEGTMLVRLSDDVVLTLQAVYSEEVPYNIISGPQICAQQKITIDFDELKLKVKNQQINIDILRRNGLYWLSGELLIKNDKDFQLRKRMLKPVNLVLCNIRSDSIHPKKWTLEFIHNLMAHANLRQIKKSISNGDLPFVKLDDIDWSGMESYSCPHCHIGKGKRHNHYTNGRDLHLKRFSRFEYLHTDIMGPFRGDANFAPNYLITYTDEVTRYRWIYPLSNATERAVWKTMKKLITYIRTQYNVKVKEILMDRGAQYTSTMVRDLLDEFGIRPRYTSVGDKQANGVAERLNRTIMDDARTLLASANLPEKLWYHAAVFAVTIRNSLYVQKINNSPNKAANIPGIAINKILPFGQPVVIFQNLGKKTFPRGKIVHALHPSYISYGYVFYDRDTQKCTDTTDFKIVKTITGNYLNSEKNVETLNEVGTTVRHRSSNISAEFQQMDQSTNDCPVNQRSNSRSTEPQKIDKSEHDSLDRHMSNNVPSKPQQFDQSTNDCNVRISPNDMSTRVQRLNQSTNDGKENNIHKVYDDEYDGMSLPRTTSGEVSGDSSLILPDPVSTPRDVLGDLSTPAIHSGVSTANLSRANGVNNNSDMDLSEDLQQSYDNYPLRSNGILAKPMDSTMNSSGNNNVESGKRTAHRHSSQMNNKRQHTSEIMSAGAKVIDSHYDLETLDIQSLTPEDRESLFDSLSDRYRDSSLVLRTTDSLYGGGGTDISDPDIIDNHHIFNISKSMRQRKAKYNDLTVDQTQAKSTDVIANLIIQEDANPKYNPIKQEKRVTISLVNSLKHLQALPKVNIDSSLSYQQAISKNNNHQEREEYKEAYNSEISQLLRRNTWDTSEIDVKTIDAHKILSTMFIFNTKRDGRRKCRLVVRGDLQHSSTYERNLESNTIHHYALMTILSLALEDNMIIKQLDITAAYLYADLKEELYIRAPPHMKLQNKAFKLKKSLYGLKQSGANWYTEITKFLKEKCGLREAEVWACVFTKDPPLSIIVCIFVDDIIVTGRDEEQINNFIDALRAKYDTKIVHDGLMNDKGTANYDILGLDLEYKRNNFMKFGMLDILKHKLPLLNLPLNKESKYNQVPIPPSIQPLKVEKNLYIAEADYKTHVRKLQQIVGLLSYIAHKFRFEALYHINVLAQYQLYPTDEVMEWAHMLVQYFWNTKEKRLIWTKNKTPHDYEFTVISDASNGCEPEGKSRLGWFYEIFGHKISARSTKSSYVCTSSTDAEICAMNAAMKFDLAIKMLLFKLTGERPKYRLLSDSKPALSIITNPNSSVPPSKPTYIRTMALREMHDEGSCEFNYISTEENVADILTKLLSRKQFNRLLNKWME
ncbi:hypothetical protein KDRO_A04650 [Kluyveromyces lactis]|nr:hypothetical protein KDRO_A04650 [Kluyveromyces lactis]